MNDLLAVGAIVALVALALLMFRPVDRALRREGVWMADVERAQTLEAARQRFGSDLHDALEMAPDEDAIAAVVAHVLASTLPEHPAELLLADSSAAHLTTRVVSPTAGAAGCNVAAPFDCPAVRRATAQSFQSSSALNACPHLRERGEARSALCAPISFMARSVGVLHLTGADGDPPNTDIVDRVGVLAGQVGTAIGTVRAFSKAQLQASTDSLTGLLNRRSAEDKLVRRLSAGESFAVVMADLDHFKLLNDTYGHEVGDRALRVFADTVRNALRSDDLFARWGGEEFVIALPNKSRREASVILNRIRVLLATACERTETPTVTASFGIADTAMGTRLDQLLRFADEALLAAKSNGRNRVEVAGRPIPESSDNAMEPQP